MWMPVAIEDFWRGDSGEMERGRVSAYSDVSEPTASPSQDSTGGLLLPEQHNLLPALKF